MQHLISHYNIFATLNYLRKNISCERCLSNRTDFLSCIRGYHVLHGETRTAVMGKQLLHERKPELNVVARSRWICHGGEGFLCHRSLSSSKIPVLNQEVR